MSAHTPGPWNCEPCKLSDLKYVVTDSRDNVLTVDEDTHLANARLIAAAPDLLEAIMSAVEWGSPMAEAPITSRPEWFDKCRAAISKAIGEKL